MATRFTWLGTLALAVLNVLTAQAQQPLPQPAPGPAPPGSHSGIEAAADLIRAAHHLEALGSPELAAQVRQHARVVLERESQRLAHEQAMLQQLAQHLDLAQTQYMVQAIIARASVTQEELEEIVQDVAGEAAMQHDEGVSVLTLDRNCCVDVLRALNGQDESRVEILSRPQIVTLEGQPASVIVGSEIALVAGVDERGPAVRPLPVVGVQPIDGLMIIDEDHPHAQFIGVSTILTPSAAGENRIHVEVVLENSTVHNGEPIIDAQTGQTHQAPVKDTMRAQSIVEVPSGGMFIMAIPTGSADECAFAEHAPPLLLLFAAPRMMRQ